MKKLFTIIFTSLLYIQSFAYNMLQIVVETEQAPPTPNGEGSITPYAVPGTPGSTPINFIVPFLLISAILLTFYILKKNKIKTV